ncbi:hypothetical protein ACIHAX_17810 [Nocardia sp. NPDC051929]
MNTADGLTGFHSRSFQISGAQLLARKLFAAPSALRNITVRRSAPIVAE